MRRRRTAVRVTVSSLAILATACGARAAAPKAAPTTPPHRAPAAAVSTAPAAPAGPIVPAGTLVATMNGAVPGSPTPGSPSDATVPATWYGYPSALPVVASQPGWLEVRLAQRPNGSTAWVPAGDVTLAETPYFIEVDLTTEHLTVFDAGTQILDFPAGVGTPTDPTPTGTYFMTMQYPAPSAGYGPFVLVTSDHSDSITDWEATGDAIIAIHGPITSADDALIGTTGAAISHGCIRLHDADLAQLAMIPAGTLIDVVA
jgi:lipoprotein-anchoring transpeptidase ErfK/SrfK